MKARVSLAGVLRVACHAAVLAATISASGCAWFGWFQKRPASVSTASAASAASAASLAPQPTRVTQPPVIADARPASAARAACANYAQVLGDATYPRDAVLRGLDSGQATVWFEADGKSVSVLSVMASDPAFGSSAVDTVKRLVCKVDRPTRFEIPFAWRAVR